MIMKKFEELEALLASGKKQEPKPSSLTDGKVSSIIIIITAKEKNKKKEKLFFFYFKKIIRKESKKRDLWSRIIIPICLLTISFRFSSHRTRWYALFHTLPRFLPLIFFFSLATSAEPAASFEGLSKEQLEEVFKRTSMFTVQQTNTGTAEPVLDIDDLDLEFADELPTG